MPARPAPRPCAAARRSFQQCWRRSLTDAQRFLDVSTPSVITRASAADQAGTLWPGAVGAGQHQAHCGFFRVSLRCCQRRWPGLPAQASRMSQWASRASRRSAGVIGTRRLGSNALRCLQHCPAPSDADELQAAACSTATGNFCIGQSEFQALLFQRLEHGIEGRW